MLLIVGGTDRNGMALDTAEAYDTNTGQWLASSEFALKTGPRSWASYGFVRRSMCEDDNALDERVDDGEEGRSRTAESAVIFDHSEGDGESRDIGRKKPQPV